MGRYENSSKILKNLTIIRTKTGFFCSMEEQREQQVSSDFLMTIGRLKNLAIILLLWK